MRRLLPFAIAVLVLPLFPASAQAQQSAATPQALDALVATHTRAMESDRAELRAFLDRPDVREVADDVGLDVVAASGAVATLGAADLARLAGHVSQADAALAGGDNLVISSTLIIIILLVLIIILVA